MPTSRPCPRSLFPKHLFPRHVPGLLLGGVSRPARGRRARRARGAGGAAAAGLRAQSENEHETRRRRRRLGHESVLRGNPTTTSCSRARAAETAARGREQGGGRARRSARETLTRKTTPRSSGWSRSTSTAGRAAASTHRRCSSSSCARTRAPARRARRLPRSWRFWRKIEVRVHVGAAAAAGLLGGGRRRDRLGNYIRARLPKRRAAPAPARRPRRGGGGDHDRDDARGAARSARGPGRVPPRVKGGSPGTRPAASETARARFDPETRAGGSEDFFFFAKLVPKEFLQLWCSHFGVAHVSRTGTRRRARRRREGARHGEGHGEGRVGIMKGQVAREMHEDADGPTSNAVPGRRWAPGGRSGRTRPADDGLGQRPQAGALSTDADAAKVDREVSRRWVAAAKAGDVAALRGVLDEVRGRARQRSRVSSRRTTTRARTPVTRDRRPALHWSASRGIDALDATAWLLDVCAMTSSGRTIENQRISG